MTALCPGGGPSAPKPGVGPAAYVTGGEIATIVATAFNVPAWIALAAYAAAQEIAITSLCAADPPAMPTFDLVDITTILGSTPFLGQTSYAKLDALVANAAWYVFCQCTTGTTPPPPSAPTYPSGAPTVNPTNAQPQQVTACWVKTGQVKLAGAFLTADVVSYPHSGGLGGPCTTPGDAVIAACMPATGMRVSGTVNSDGTSNSTASLTLSWQNASGAVLRNDNFGPFSPGSSFDTGVRLPPTGWAGVTNRWNGGSTSANNTVTSTVQVWCPGQTPGQPQNTCCPPDPTLAAKLDQLMAAVEFIVQSLPVPLTSYAESTVHSGLTGNGRVTIGAGCIAVKVTITTDSASLGVSSGDPSFLWDRGYIVPIAAEGTIAAEHRLTYSPQLYALPTLTEQVGYSLHPGITASIIELVRGP